MTDWLYDTFVWTGVLIAAVLLVRRPVARHFGPQVAYALWALPLARLVMPPLVLPASLAPAGQPPAAEPLVVMLAQAVPASAGGWTWLVPLTLALWLGGSAILLAWRTRDYLAMRRELLAEARPMGEAGAVRLVETPAVASPVAFGIRDKVVAMPPGFMVQPDRAARDLAIAHELAHHRGNDLLANLAAQPLLALHWFNPLAWAGWRAMRSDQEAACDARVIAGRERSERAAYAQVIAGFAAGPRLALAAPMACPVLGEKSIIHRLKCLTLGDVSATRRTLGLAAIGASALVVLPLTASISYANVAASEPAAAPVALAPVAPAAPQPPIRVAHAEVVMTEVAKELAAAEQDISHAMAEHNRAMSEHQAAVRVATRDIPQVIYACEAGSAVVTHSALPDGRQMIVICEQAADHQARTDLQDAHQTLNEARLAVRSAPGLSSQMRAKMLQDIESRIGSIEQQQVAYMPGAAFTVTMTSVVLLGPARYAQPVPSAPLSPPRPPVLIHTSVAGPPASQCDIKPVDEGCTV